MQILKQHWVRSTVKEVSSLSVVIQRTYAEDWILAMTRKKSNDTARQPGRTGSRSNQVAGQQNYGIQGSINPVARGGVKLRSTSELRESYANCVMYHSASLLLQADLSTCLNSRYSAIDLQVRSIQRCPIDLLQYYLPQ